jgi:hypothetical protein
MSTRALYTFSDTMDKNVNVYKHHDGYPSGACEAIQNALPLAWELPRFESDEFAAAFVAGNKSQGGSVRLFPRGNPTLIANKHASDIEYRYEITLDPVGETLWIKAYRMRGIQRLRSVLFFEGTLRAMENLED